MESSNQFLGTERISKLMQKYAIPCIISLLVGALYNIVDQIFIANASYLGSYGNAANTVEFPDTHRFRILIPILYLIDMLSNIIIFIIKYIVLWSSISKSIHKYLVHDSTLSPRRNLVSRYYTKIIILVKLP